MIRGVVVIVNSSAGDNSSLIPCRGNFCCFFFSLFLNYFLTSIVIVINGSVVKQFANFKGIMCSQGLSVFSTNKVSTMCQI